jgi:bla regulator protein blaR1
MTTLSARNFGRTASTIRLVGVRLPVAIGILTAFILRAQSAAVLKPHFEVASIKRNVSGLGGGFNPLPGGRLTIENVPLRLLIQNAYDVFPFQVSAGPGWIDSDKWDVDAKADGNPSIPEMIGPMLVALLEDRFRLKVHRETKQLPVYILAVAKGGVKLSETKAKCWEEHDANGRPSPPPAPGEPPLPPCGRVIGGLSPSGGHLEGRSASLGSLIFTLSHLLGRTIIDKTGFTGTFDMHLEFARDQALPGTPGGPAPGEFAPDVSKPSIFTALQEQLGLKLKSGKGPVEILVIDHVEKPSEN